MFGSNFSNAMSNAHSVTIKRVRVIPLAAWKLPPSKLRDIPVVEWPLEYTGSCWWCTHVFEGIPAILPVHVGTKHDETSVFSGYFCSWNCVRAFADALKREPMVGCPPGADWIGVLAYLTSHGVQCCSDNELHDLGLCDCAETTRVAPQAAPSRLLLKDFGGSLTIDEYRAAYCQCRIVEPERVQRRFSVANLSSLAISGGVEVSAERRRWMFRHARWSDFTHCSEHTVSFLPCTHQTMSSLQDSGNGILTGHEPMGQGGGAPVPRRSQSRKRPASGTSPSGRGGRRSRASVDAAPVANALSNPAETAYVVEGSGISGKAREATPVAPVSSDVDSQAASVPTAGVPAAEAEAQEEQEVEMLACNEEHAFYRQKLSTFGDLLSVMNIQINKRPAE